MKNNEVSKAIVIAGAALIASAFFFLYAYLAVFAPLRFNSPDEAANFFFTRLFAETGQLWSFEPLNLVVPGLVHPRSVSVSDSFMVPGGFLGLPVIYGSLAKVLGLAAVPFLTPFFGVAAAAFLGLLAARFFGRRTGAFAALLLLVQPAWWYESGRLLMPNVLFNFLLIAAAFFYWTAPFARGRAIKALAKVRHADAALAGVCLGLALAVRPAEAYWIILSVAVLVAFHFRRLSWGKLAVAGGFALLTLAPFLLLNRAVYGGFLATGYGSGLTDVPVASLPQGRGAKLLGGLRPYLFPLGFAPRAALANFWTYGVKFFWWWSLLAGTGLAAAAYAAIGRWRRRRRRGRSLADALLRQLEHPGQSRSDGRDHRFLVSALLAAGFRAVGPARGLAPRPSGRETAVGAAAGRRLHPVLRPGRPVRGRGLRRAPGGPADPAPEPRNL